MTPLEQAAADATNEALSLLADAQLAVTLEGESDILYDRATDAIEAYERARERALAARKLADHHSGTYNAWTETPAASGGEAA